MRPGLIPDDAIWEGGQRIVVSAPDGNLTHETIAPVEAIVDFVQHGVETIPRYNVRCVLEKGDLEKLQEGGHVWVSFYGAMPPFSVDVTDKDSK